MHTIIAGSRTLADYGTLRLAVADSGFHITKVISGAAPGADRLGERYAREFGIPLEKFPAEWSKYGKRRAGKIRNVAMARNAEALIAVWDGESRGTQHMIKVARLLGLRIFVFDFSEEPQDG